MLKSFRKVSLAEGLLSANPVASSHAVEVLLRLSSSRESGGLDSWSAVHRVRGNAADAGNKTPLVVLFPDRGIPHVAAPVWHIHI